MTASPRELVAIEGSEIVIRVPMDALKTAAEIAIDKWLGYENHLYVVTDPAAFAVELVRQLRREREDGDTSVTDMLDKAVVAAVEYGCEGIEKKTISP